MTIFENWYVVSQGNHSLLQDRATSLTTCFPFAIFHVEYCSII